MSGREAGRRRKTGLTECESRSVSWSKWRLVRGFTLETHSPTLEPFWPRDRGRMYSKAILQRKIQTNTYLVGPFPLYYITILLYYYITTICTYTGSICQITPPETVTPPEIGQDSSCVRDDTNMATRTHRMGGSPKEDPGQGIRQKKIPMK